MNTSAEETTKTYVPALDQDNIANWLDEDLTGYLMGRKRAHLALNSDRPKINEEVLDGYRSPKEKNKYKEKVEAAQEFWDERNDLCIWAMLESSKHPNCLESNQIIKAKLKEGKTSKEITEALRERFDSKDPRVVNDLMSKWTNNQLFKGEKATSLVIRLNAGRKELEKKGKKFGEMVGRLLDALGSEPRYAANVAAMHTIKDLKYEDAVAQLRNIDIVEGLRAEQRTVETAALTVRRPSNKSTTVVKCQICDKGGHTAKNCYWRGNKQDNKTQNGNKTQQNNSTVKNDKCYNCGKRGHHAKQCHLPDKRLRNSGQTNTTGDKRQSEEKSNGLNSKKARTNNSGGRGNFDSNEEYAQMLSSSDQA